MGHTAAGHHTDGSSSFVLIKHDAEHSTHHQVTALMAKTQLFYPPVRGRGEVIRLALHHAGVEYEELSVDRAQMKTNLDAFPFGQVPR